MERVYPDDHSYSSSSSSSWSADNADYHQQQQDDDDNNSLPSQATISLEAPSIKPRNVGNVPPAVDTDMGNVPADQERQILLLMLLAQVW